MKKKEIFIYNEIKFLDEASGEKSGNSDISYPDV